MALPDGAASVFAQVTRVSALDVNGFPVSGLSSYVTDTLVKATIAPAMETGDDLTLKNADGNLAVRYKHGDMIKYYTLTLEWATPDPGLEAAICGGVVLTDNAAALGAPTGLTVTGQTTLGTLPAGTYGYKATQYNQYGESAATSEVQVTNTGTTSENVIGGLTIAAGALGARIYGRTPGGEQLLGSIPAFAGMSTTSASGTGSVTSLAVSGGLTKPIPAGAQFQISGDTNSPKITFTTTAEVGIGAISIPVSAPSVTTTIAAASILPVFVDTGSITPNGALPTSDQTAGPGIAGYQAPSLGVVGNPNFLGIEFFTKAVVNGGKVYPLGNWRWIFPGCKNFHQDSREISNTIMTNSYVGEAFENPNFGTGPFADVQFDTTKVWDRIRAASTIVPVSALSPGSETY